jgi:O-antigen/teichoic acid export membrane protein
VLVLGRRDPGSSGSYGAVSVASKALVLIAFVLAGFLLPEAASRRAAGHHALTPLAVSLAFVAVPSALLILISIVSGHELLSVAFGRRLAGSSAALTPLALAMALLAASVMLTHYLLAAGSRAVIVVLTIAAVVATAALAIAGSGPQQVAWTDAAAQGLLVLVLVCLVARHHRAIGTR